MGRDISPPRAAGALTSPLSDTAAPYWWLMVPEALVPTSNVSDQVSSDRSQQQQRAQVRSISSISYLFSTGL
eukprot:SAG25_NODE_12056_length_289_cov_0.610526_1_plen_71_part_01